MATYTQKPDKRPRPKPKTDPDPDGGSGVTPPPDKLMLDATSFNSPERLECQVRFESSFGDLLRHLFEAVDPRREGLMETSIVDRNGTQHFPDQIIQFMLWVQAKRTNPDAQLEDFDDLVFSEVAGAHIDGLLGKERKSSGSKKPSPGPGSADSSTD